MLIPSLSIRMTQQNQITHTQKGTNGKKSSRQTHQLRPDTDKDSSGTTIKHKNRWHKHSFAHSLTHTLHESSIIQNETNKHELQVERKLTKQTRFGSRYITDNCWSVYSGRKEGKHWIWATYFWLFEAVIILARIIAQQSDMNCFWYLFCAQLFFKLWHKFLFNVHEWKK